jgi:hypothetical protein
MQSRDVKRKRTNWGVEGTEAGTTRFEQGNNMSSGSGSMVGPIVVGPAVVKGMDPVPLEVLVPQWTPYMSRAWHGPEEEVHQFEEGEAAVLWAAEIVQEGLSPQEVLVLNASNKRS